MPSKDINASGCKVVTLGEQPLVSSHRFLYNFTEITIPSSGALDLTLVGGVVRVVWNDKNVLNKQNPTKTPPN